MGKLEIYVFFVQLVAVLSEDVVSYKGYRVYKVSEKGFKIPKLKIPNRPEPSILMEHHEFDSNNNPYTVRSYLLPECNKKAFERLLDAAGNDYNISTYDLQKEIEEEKSSNAGTKSGLGVWDVTNKYYTFDEMSSFLVEVSKLNKPDTNEPIAFIEAMGQTTENREMYLVKISSNHYAQNPIVFIEAGLHAREWTAPSTALYTIFQLVKNYTFTSTILDGVDFYIIPISNPDGYEYSRTKDRLWRKTRSYFKGHCGVDGNRNFDFHWGEGGSSSNPESEIFKGPYPFSEPETRNIRDVGKKYADRINVFVALHAFGPSILYPWSYKVTKPAPQSDVMGKIAKQAKKAIKRYSGTDYACGPAALKLYEAAGGSDDYFKGVLGVDLCFTLELSSANKDSFIVPTNALQGITSETFEALKVIAHHAARYHKKVKKLSSKWSRLA